MVKCQLVKFIILFWIKSHFKTFQQIYQNYFYFNSGHMLPNTISWTCRKWDKIISMVFYFIPPIWNKFITIFPKFLSSLNVSYHYVNFPSFFYRKFLELCILNYFSWITFYKRFNSSESIVCLFIYEKSLITVLI